MSLIQRMQDFVSSQQEARDEPSFDRPISQSCTRSQFDDPAYPYWCGKIGEVPRLHRKQWEFCYILQVLDTHDMLRPGKAGLGFGVGSEPLAAVMAARGVEVLATDLEQERAGAIGWIDTDQHASGKADLNSRRLCDPAAFERLVDFRHMDMTRIDADLAGRFDFCWSACAFEHLGSIAAGLEFVERSIDTLKPGGIAVHTTEFNCSSDAETIDHAGTVLFRRRDFRNLARRLRRRGYTLKLNFKLGDQPLDHFVDVPPYAVDDHLKLRLEEWTTTSFGIVAVPIDDRDPTEIASQPDLDQPVSQACTQAQLETPAFARWCSAIGEVPRLHRKQWEYCYIMSALAAHDMLRPERHGLGFEVGNEPLAAAFAAQGVAVLASDLDPRSAAARGWGSDRQPKGKAVLNDRGLCESSAFDRLLDYRHLDMRAIDDGLTGKFDFCWSTGAASHLGSIAAGLEFIERSIDCLRPGGIAVHAIEFNCSSDLNTLDRDGTSLFRRRDLRALARRLHAKGYELILNFNLGDLPVDLDVDMPPYRSDRHLKLKIQDWTSTSFGILAVPLSSQKGSPWRRS